MKTVAFTEAQLTNLIEQLETSFNRITGEDDLELNDYFGTLTALRAATPVPTEVEFADELSKMVNLRGKICNGNTHSKEC